MRNSRGEKDVSVKTEGSVRVQNSLLCMVLKRALFFLFIYFVKNLRFWILQIIFPAFGRLEDFYAQGLIKIFHTGKNFL